MEHGSNRVDTKERNPCCPARNSGDFDNGRRLNADFRPLPIMLSRTRSYVPLASSPRVAKTDSDD